MRRPRHEFLAPFTVLLLGVSLFAFSVLAKDPGKKNVPETGLSHVRVVRLSFVQGTVTVRRPGSDEWASASVNTPIEEGFAVATGKGSFAEVQFENGSVVRLGELSNVGFTELALTPQGGHINHLALENGYATCRVTSGHHDEFQLVASNANVTPQGKAEFRTDLSDERVRVEVFGGKLRASTASETEQAKKNQTLTLAVGSDAAFEVSNKVQEDTWDKWSRARDQQATLAYNDSAVDLGGPLFGWDDLDVYGAWGFFPGFGYGWAPYEPVGWSPYAAGMWSWYPSWGYTWISAEPWGWLPFHYGFWNFAPSMGWFWTPGSFAAWNPALVNWYSGPGWIGWSPVGRAGVGGAAPCAVAAGCMTAVPRGVLSSGKPILAGAPYLLHPGANDRITAITRPDVAPEHSAMLSGQPFNGRLAFRGSAAAVPFTRGAEGAPSSVVMGRQVAAESFIGPHASFRGSTGPAFVRLGGAMGGNPAVPSAALSARPLSGGRGPSGPAGTAPTRTPQPQVLTRSAMANSPVGGAGFGARGGSGGIARGSSSAGISRGSGGGAASHSAGGGGMRGGAGGGHR